MAHFHIFETAHGVAAIAWSGPSIVRFRLPATSIEETQRNMWRSLPYAVAAEPSSEIGAVIDKATRYFAGEHVDFSAVPLDLGPQEPFSAEVYAYVRGLGWGETTTYGAVAKALNAGPEAARAVGQAMARNPIPLIVPCHRVTAAGGKVGGFSAPGGSDAKARMLLLEGVDTSPPPASQATFGF